MRFQKSFKRIHNQKSRVVWFPLSWMAASLTAPKTSDYAKGQRSRWRGGPRLPATALRHARTKDDLEVEGPSNVPSDNSFTIAMLAEHFNARESGTRAHPVNRASRRWALDPKTEERWLQLLQAGPPSKPYPPNPTSASSPADTRWQFYGPRQPRQTHKINLSATHCPYTRLTTIYSPDTPELETPDDKVPESYVTKEKSVESDADDVSLGGPEFLITPFPLWEHPLAYSVSTQGHTATEMNDTSAISELQHWPVAIPPLQVDTSRETQDNVWILNHGVSIPGTPISFQSESSHLRRLSRPRLSIIISSWPRSSTSFRGKF